MVVFVFTKRILTVMRGKTVRPGKELHSAIASKKKQNANKAQTVGQHTEADGE